MKYIMMIAALMFSMSAMAYQPIHSMKCFDTKDTFHVGGVWTRAGNKIFVNTIGGQAVFGFDILATDESSKRYAIDIGGHRYTVNFETRWVVSNDGLIQIECTSR